jgi:RimJ/RimL family protein N-acetyltransferase
VQSIGFQKEAILRKHEIHNGELQDMVVFGILKQEFYAKYDTMFSVMGNS